MLEVQNNTALVTVHNQIGCRFFANMGRRHVAGIVAFGRPLDFDHFGPKIGQEQRADRARHHMGEVDDFEPS